MSKVMKKTTRDQLILNLLTKFKICSRNQIASILFKNNSNPINVCNRVMKRLTMDGSVLPVARTKDQTYLYTSNPATIHHRSNKINHQLKIVDFYIQRGCPERFIIEPIFGCYEPDIFMKDDSNNSICVEIQLTPISHKKMQQKFNQFVHEYGKEHDSKLLVLCSNQQYSKLKLPSGFRLIKQPIPNEIVL